MNYTISNQMIHDFISGMIPVVAMIMVGGFIAFILGGMKKRYPFSRLALVIAMTPVGLIHFIHNGPDFAIYLFAMIVVLFGIMTDGVAYLLEPRPKRSEEPEPTESLEQPVPQTASMHVQEPSIEMDPGMVVWEKAAE